LAAGLCPDPLEEHSASAVPLTAIDGRGMEHSLSEIMRRCVAGTGREEQVRWLGEMGSENRGSWRENVFKPIIARVF